MKRYFHFLWQKLKTVLFANTSWHLWNFFFNSQIPIRDRYNGFLQHLIVTSLIFYPKTIFWFFFNFYLQVTNSAKKRKPRIIFFHCHWRVISSSLIFISNKNQLIYPIFSVKFAITLALSSKTQNRKDKIRNIQIFYYIENSAQICIGSSFLKAGAVSFYREM